MNTVAQVLNQEVTKIRVHWKAYVLGVIVFLVIPQIHMWADGRYYNRVITFQNGVDPENLMVESAEYCPGDDVRVYLSFCKNRQVQSAVTDWWISNGTLVEIEKEEEKLAPGRLVSTGCFGEDEPTLRRLHTIPIDTSEGFHYSDGLTRHTLRNGEIRYQNYRTEPYYVKSQYQCYVEDLETIHEIHRLGNTVDNSD